MALVVKNPLASEGDMRDLGSIPGLGRSPAGGGHGNPLQYSCLGNPMDRWAWQAPVHKVSKSQTWLKWFRTHAHTDLILVGKFYPTEKGKNCYGGSLQKPYFSKGQTKFVFIFIHLFGCAGYCCSTQTLTCGIWDWVPRPGIKPRSLALGYRVVATGPLGKSQQCF